MKKVMSIILYLLICAALIGGGYALYKHFLPEDNPTIENPSEETPADTELSEPINASAIFNSRIKLKSIPELRFNQDGSDPVEPAIRFTCLIDKSLVDEVLNDENKKIGFLMAPLHYFDQVNTDSKTGLDWITAFKDAELNVAVAEYESLEDFGELDSNTYTLKVSIGKVKNKNIGLSFVGMGYFVDYSSGTPVYTYCRQPDGETYRTTARSVVELSGEALNANALGERSYTVEEITKMKNYINIGVDIANGLAEPTDDGSTPTVTFTDGTELNISVGGNAQIKYSLIPNSENLKLPARYISMNESVAVVSSKGVVTGIGEGSTTVKVYVAGKLYMVNVTVSNND